MREADSGLAMTWIESNDGFKGVADFGSEKCLHPKRCLSGFFPIAAAQTKMVGCNVRTQINRRLTVGNGLIVIPVV